MTDVQFFLTWASLIWLLAAIEQKVGAVIITALDEVAWLLNLRGGDVDYNPVFISYVIVTPDAATLYVDSAKVIIHLPC